MSWRMLLSKYPDAILKDEIALLLLSLLERGGLLTEDELQSQLNIGRRQLTQKLFSLHKDSLVEYSSHHIRVSERGKQVIDRFGLNDDIIDDLLSTLPLAVDNALSLKKAVKEYRDHAFNRYLSSLISIQCWHSVCGIDSFKEGGDEDDEIVGLLAILLDDLRNWYLSSSKDDGKNKLTIMPLSNEYKIDHELKSVYSEDLTNSKLLKKTFRWISILNDIRASGKVWSKINSLDSHPETVFSCMKAHTWVLSPSLWKDDWVSKGRLHASILVCNSSDEIIRNTVDYGLQHWSEYDIQNHSLARIMQLSIPGPITDVPSDLLPKLLKSSSLEELQRTTGINYWKLEKILASINGKCEEFLSEGDAEKD